MIIRSWAWRGVCSKSGMHTLGRALSIAALLTASGVSTAARADRVPLAGSGAANPAGVMAPALPATPPVAPRLPVLVNADAAIPANGSVLLDAKSATTTATIWLEDVNGRTEGTARVLDSFIIWTPEHALTPNRLYSLIVAMPNTSLRDMYPINVTKELEPSRPMLTASLRLERVDNMASPKCCASIPGFAPRPTMCFSTETNSMVRMRGMISSTAAPSQLTQFMFRLKRADDPNADSLLGFTPLSGIQPLLWTEPADEYCAQLSAFDIGSQRVFIYDDLPTSCPSADDLGDLSPREIPLDATRSLSHTVCSVPPRDFEDQWCDTNRPDCSSSPLTSGCENFDHLCEGGPAPTAKSAGTGGRSGGSAGVPGGSPSIPGVDNPPQPHAIDHRDDAGFGCSVQRRSGGSGLAAVGCGLFGLWLAVRRRSLRRIASR